MIISEITVMHMDRPLGIDVVPYFSWKIKSDRQGTMQEAYRVTVRDENGDPVYDTGKVISDQSAYVEYQGKTLKSRTVYSVEVTVRDNYGNQAVLGTSFETAFLATDDWKAKWAESVLKRRKAKPGFGKQYPATMFRKKFCLKAKPVSARVYATCHGIYRLYINGERPDKREFAPEHTVYGKYLCYQTYDITPLLREGENVLGMYVGDGWYLGAQSLPDMKIKHAHAVLFQLEVKYEDGSTQSVYSDSDVKTSYGPVRSSDLFAGESYDANMIEDGWYLPGYEDGGWKDAYPASYGYDNLRAQPEEPVLAIKLLPVRKILISPKKEVILDFGQVMSGRIRMKVKAPEGTVITLEHCEVLDRNGNFFNNIMGGGGVGKGCDQKDQYICDGKERTYEPLFTFHGFRYVKVSGLGDNVSPEDFSAVVLSTSKKNTGSFFTSDERINRLYENTRWSQYSNMMSIPTDCPQREKAGWTGDMLTYARTAMLNEDCTTIFTRWLHNVSCDQDKYGIVPMVVPNDGPYPMTGKLINMTAGEKGKATSSGWGDAAVVVPYSMYQVTGNTSILRQQYDCMKRWCDYVIRQSAKTPKGSTAPAEYEKYLWDTGYHYGEWLIPSQNKNGLDMKNLKKIMAMSSCYTAPVFGWNSIRLFSEIAALLGKEADASYYSDVAAHMKKAIQHCIIRADGTMPSELMGAYVLPVYFDLVPEKMKESFAEHLVRIIEDNGFCLDTGFLATPFLLDSLCRIGRRELAYRLLWQDKCPSWLYEVNHGATTIWESWYGYDNDGNPGSLSFNHYAFGAVDDWMFRNIGGIDTDTPGFRHLIFHPVTDSGITSCCRTFDTVYGLAKCRWEIKDGTFEMDITVPCNTTATVILPDGSSEDVGSGDYHYTMT